MIQFNEKLLKKNNNKDFKRDLFKLMNNSVFKETMENILEDGDIKLVTTEKRRNYFVSEAGFSQKTCWYWWINLPM